MSRSARSGKCTNIRSHWSARKSRNIPKEEAEELALIYEARGVDLEQAREVSRALLAQPEQALDVLSREELGLNPDDLGSPIGAAVSSFISFALGAAMPADPIRHHTPKYRHPYAGS